MIWPPTKRPRGAPYGSAGLGANWTLVQCSRRWPLVGSRPLLAFTRGRPRRPPERLASVRPADALVVGELRPRAVFGLVEMSLHAVVQEPQLLPQHARPRRRHHAEQVLQHG